ncbi:pol [Spider monkey simian foamy virus]|uniref:Pro-Pol polyprotein n=1 Tax=Spider monkey simian foamy virus TaxID=2170200 RepID=A8HC78_9RETR|nr:pol [Spider monkey simian foamy virus]ABV59399.1 pol [Spider monkey simian foamy virus]
MAQTNIPVEIKGTQLNGFWDTGAQITCIPQSFLLDEQPIGTTDIETIHGKQKQKLYYLKFKVLGRKVEAEVTSSTLAYVILAPIDIPWYKPTPLELTIKLPVQDLKNTLVSQANIGKEDKIKLAKLLDKYDDLWQQWDNQVGNRKITPHNIATGTYPPKPQKQYHINPKAKPSIQIVINDLLKQGVLRQSTSPMNTPVYPVPKPDGKWRMVLDYRAVNKTIPLIAAQNQHSLGILTNLIRHKYKSTIDLSNGFWAHPITEDSQWITAFTWEGKQHVWTRLPQGFLNSPALFTADVVDILKEVPGVSVYVDDIYISSPTMEEHFQVLDSIFRKLLETGYIVSLKKSALARYEVNFLGFVISETGRGLTSEFRERLQEITPPTTLKQLQSILGFLNFARNFVPNFSELVQPLYQLISTASGNFIQWTAEHTLRLNELISALNHAGNLEQRRGDSPLVVKVNASDKTGYIRYYNDNSLIPIAYASHVFSTAELKFTPLEKLLVTMHRALLKGIDLALGQPIKVYSPIASMQKLQKTPIPERKALSTRWVTWLSYLEDPRITFYYDKTLPDLKHVPASTDNNIITLLPITEYEAVFYTDGSAIKSPKTEQTHSAGMGIVMVVYTPEPNITQQWSIPLGDHTAQYAEISAVEFACKKASLLQGPVLIVTDSDYVARSANKELPFWRSNGFLNNKKKPLKHISKWKNISDSLLLKRNITIVHEPGHQPSKTSIHTLGNSLADKLAVQGSYSVNTINKIPSLDAELNQILEGNLPKGYPKQYKYVLKNNELIVQRPEGDKIIPPKADRLPLVKTAHELAHTGREATLLKLQTTHWWPNMRKDIITVLRQCKPCLQTDSTNLTPIPPVSQPRPVKPFDKFFIDYIGPLPPSHGFSYVLVIVDARTGFTWLYPTKAPSTNATINSLNLLLGTAIPKVLHSDQGSAFTSATFAEWAKDRSIQLEFSTPYHPQSSGMVERKNKEIKRLITKLLVGRPTKWYPLLPTVQLALNNTYSPRTKLTPHKLLFGVDGNVPFANQDTLDLTREEELSLLAELRSSFLPSASPPASSRSWRPSVGLLVQERVARPSQLRPKWKKPVIICELINDRTVVIVDKAGNKRTVSIDNLKLTPHQKNSHGSTPDITGMDVMEQEEEPGNMD